MRPAGEESFWEFPLFPEQAASTAARVDLIYFVLSAMSTLIMLFIFSMMLLFLVRYRAGSRASRKGQIQRTLRYELSWISVLLVIAIALFAWGAAAYIDMNRPPADARTYHVVGRQWMWEIEHPNGRRELNELHLPVGQPARFVITSEDVIHSFYVPAFRMKQDAVPGMYTTTWTTPTRVGEYHLFCAEYCGADHSRMVGRVTVLDPAEYEQWLAAPPDVPVPLPMDQDDDVSFRVLGCVQCHKPDTEALAPRLEGLFGREVELENGRVIIADEEYIRESIIDPGAKIVRGYQPIMPSYKGLLDERELMQVVAAVRALEHVDQPEGEGQ